MEADKCSPFDRQAAVPGDVGPRSQNRRTRLEAGLPPELVDLLHRTARVHAHLLNVIRLYGNPGKAGGQSLEGDSYGARAARGDRTLLFDCLSVACDELGAIREEVWRAMESSPATAYLPGSAGKVETMAERASRGESLFIGGDAGHRY